MRKRTRERQRLREITHLFHRSENGKLCCLPYKQKPGLPFCFLSLDGEEYLKQMRRPQTTFYGKKLTDENSKDTTNSTHV